MIPRVELTRVDRVAKNGRTGPFMGEVESENGDRVEVYVKLSAGCDQEVINLSREVIAACLAADLNLPIPRPWIVEIATEYAGIITDRELASKVARSCPVAFGSTRQSEFSAWAAGSRLTDKMVPVAAGTLLFDGIIQNPDRQPANPNCLVRGEDLRIIDHELAFCHGLVIGWIAPWRVGGMSNIGRPDKHIFIRELKGRDIDWRPIRECWEALSDERLEEYGDALPPEWRPHQAPIQSALNLIADARDNIDGCITELGRLLA